MMICDQCSIQLKGVGNFCPLCGKELKTYQGVSHIRKKRIDEALENKEFDFLWKLFDEGQEPYAEYKYEKFILQAAERIDTPSDFEVFIGKIKAKSESGNMYAKYLYGEAMRSVFRHRGAFLVSGLTAFMGNPEKHKKGTEIVKEVALSGQTSAEWTWGSLMWVGDRDTNIEKNEREAFRYINRAAQKGHPQAMLMLGRIYNKGMSGLARDYQKSQMWIKSAAYFGCKPDDIEIREGKGWLQAKDVENIQEFYGLDKFNDQSGDDASVMQMDFSQFSKF